ncbi:hypothetical protein H6F98_24875 [Microcoleus sp. FACHB-SPT15]|uniref:hypothetical protein n=1 Tax=Microcoleus sp. FACHB-SPT15 TaxID=2692830 RepID=UPI001784D5A0|nr:hypothetical protein [Microcoleus sp. FACHB-SPT15]MBD1808662.1 hypothetical protein [Microcoleus sp. FACHB-SPT15]
MKLATKNLLRTEAVAIAKPSLFNSAASKASLLFRVRRSHKQCSIFGCQCRHRECDRSCSPSD